MDPKKNNLKRKLHERTILTLKLSFILLPGLLMLSISYCDKRVITNPFDKNCPKEIFTPHDFTTKLEDNKIKLSWRQTNTNISGYIINRNENDSTMAEIGRAKNTDSVWYDSNVEFGKKYGYQLIAYADKNFSNPQESYIELIFPPSVTTLAADNFTQTSATLNGVVNANGLNTTVTFEFGNTVAYGDIVTANPGLVMGNANTNVSANLSGLIENNSYHFRLKAVNNAGNTLGEDMTFVARIPQPTVTTGQAENVGNYTATLTGVVNANGNYLQVLFEYYKISTFIKEEVIASQSPVSGFTDVYVSANVIGLTENTMYLFYIRAFNTDIDILGEGEFFNTSGPDMDCSDFNVTHKAGDVAPVTKEVNYKTILTYISGEKKCWITQNLGADKEPSSAGYVSESEAGWYWQFNRKQGYKFDGGIRTPNTKWITSINEAFDWTAANDPCKLLLGDGWRIPTDSEWLNSTFGWRSNIDAFESDLKLSMSGWFNSNGDFMHIDIGGYWSSNQESNEEAWYLIIEKDYAITSREKKARGFPIRCLKD